MLSPAPRIHLPGATAPRLVLTSLIAILIWPSTAVFAGDPPPNFVVILTDDQGWNGTSVQMDPDIAGSRSDFYQTPRLEAMAAAGMRFSNAYSASPVCSPTRASLLTGKSNAQLQMTDTVQGGDTSHGRYVSLYTGRPLSAPLPLTILREEEVTVAEWIKQADPSYVTAHFGKLHLTISDTLVMNQGYDFSDQAGWPPGDPKGIFRLTDLANSFMEDRVITGEPFMMQVFHRAVHEPVATLQTTIDKYKQLPPGVLHSNVSYAAMTEDLDTSLGMILDKVRELGIEDNTYVIYTSDNGADMNLSNSEPLFADKGSVWEGGIRVPMVVQGPGIQAGSVSDVPVTTVDLFNTVSELVGITDPLPEGVEGASLLPILNNGGQLPAGMENLRRQFGENGELYFHFPHYIYDQTPASAIRDGDFKLVKIYGEGGGPDKLFLFNLAENLTESDDPTAPANLADAMPAKTAELLTKLESWLAAVDASLPYDVSANVQLVWDGQQPGSDPDGWRSTIDVDYRDRETWLLNDASQGPQQVTISPHQPHLSKKAFRFDGDDSMTRKFFHVSDARFPNQFDNDHSASFEFWVRFDSLEKDHMLFESGDSGSGLSLTFGDGDGDGDHDEVRFRVAGDDGHELAVTSEFDLFANPTRDFVQVVAVLSDADAARFAEVYVNGALFGRVDGVNGPTGHIDWDSVDEAGLGRVGGFALGGSGGTGEKPFVSGNFSGEMAYFRFYNRAIDADRVRANYNEKLAGVSSGVVSTSGAAKFPGERPSDVREGAHEADDAIWIIQERQDILDEVLQVDILPVNGQTYGNGGVTEGIEGSLSAGTGFTSYLVHFDPLGEPTSPQHADGTVSFLRPIQGILIAQASLDQTDALLGSIGQLPTGERAFDLTGLDFLTVSDDLHQLDVSLNAMNDEIVQLRVLTMQLIFGDLDGDGDVDSLDFGIFAGSFGELDTVADLDDGGTVDILDFGIFAANFGGGSAPQIVTPEPATLMVLGLGTGFVLRRRS